MEPRAFVPVVISNTNKGVIQMHKDEVKGTAKEVRGNVKDAVGKMTGDEKLRADGAADKVEGKVQKTAGKIKDAARDALKH